MHRYLCTMYLCTCLVQLYATYSVTYLFFAAAARSRWRRFLNQLPTWVGVRPVAWASSLFLLGFG